MLSECRPSFWSSCVIWPHRARLLILGDILSKQFTRVSWSWFSMFMYVAMMYFFTGAILQFYCHDARDFWAYLSPISLYYLLSKLPLIRHHAIDVCSKLFGIYKIASTYICRGYIVRHFKSFRVSNLQIRHMKQKYTYVPLHNQLTTHFKIKWDKLFGFHIWQLLTLKNHVAHS